ncbi:MAG: peptidoglycan DD-metalloendopeptidase family protein [Anaerolineae bacterium]
MGLSIGPEPKKRPLYLIVALIVAACGLALTWRLQNRLPALLQAQLQPAPPQTPAGPSPGEVKLVYSTVVSANNPALTAGLYLDDAEHSDNSGWARAGGRTAIVTYTVQAGDTLWSIAGRFGLDVDTLRWSNPDLERNPDLLSVGAHLTILPVAGAYHTVRAGETLASIAAQYGVAEVDLTNYPLNSLLPPFNLRVGDRLIIPNGRKNVTIPPPNPDLDFPLAWPLVGRITQGYTGQHLALDIGAPYGAEVYAAAAGTVIHAQWARTGYGFTVIIDHGSSRQTLYSHLKGALVQAGQQVARGEVIGAVGSTGNSTGPHVHFEVREDGQRVNPLLYLKPE